jgi:hypothetical protein
LIIGVFLVLEEIEQNRRLAESQLVFESLDQCLQRTLALLGDNPLTSMARACALNEKITREDALILNQLYQAYVSTIMRAYRVELVGDFGVERSKLIADSNMAAIFTTQHGRDRWATYAHFTKGHPIEDYGNNVMKDWCTFSCPPGSDAILNSDKKKASAA